LWFQGMSLGDVIQGIRARLERRPGAMAGDRIMGGGRSGTFPRQCANTIVSTA